MRLFVLIIIILVLGTSGYFIIYHPNQILTPNTSTSPTVSLPASVHTYRSSQYGFQFSYPNDFSSVTPTVSFLKEPIVQFQANASKYPKTNLGDYSFSVSIGTDTANCTWGVDGGPNAGNPLRDKININGALFYKDIVTGAGAGNFYDSHIYRIIQGSRCFEIAMTIHTSNIDNYPAELGIKAVNTDPIWAELNQVLNTFKFTK